MAIDTLQISGPKSTFSSADDVLSYVDDRHVESIRIWFTDILGFLKSFSITPSELKTAFEEGMGFDGSSIEGYQRINESDMVAIPDPTTTAELPYCIGGKRCIRMFADIVNPDGTPYQNDPRQILKRTLNKLPAGIATMNVGPEAEFYYFKSKGSTETLDEAGYFDLNPMDCGDEIRECTISWLEFMGIDVEYSHHEVGPSQHEIDLRYSDALSMADNIMTYKLLVKEAARTKGVHATFMPKPLSGHNGNGMHTHLSLADDDGNNLFYDKGSAFHLSQTAGWFIAGILSHAVEMCLVTNQWFNSYKRLIPGFEAPVYVAWAERNRSALIRVPSYKPGKEQATRIELRFPDPACNPYLAFAVMLQAGLNGMYSRLELPDPITKDIYQLSNMEREKLDIQALPHDLYSAIRAAEDGTLLREVLGDQVFDKLIDTKLHESSKYRTTVTLDEITQFSVL